MNYCQRARMPFALTIVKEIKLYAEDWPRLVTQVTLNEGPDLRGTPRKVKFLFEAGQRKPPTEFQLSGTSGCPADPRLERCLRSHVLQSSSLPTFRGQANFIAVHARHTNHCSSGLSFGHRPSAESFKDVNVPSDVLCHLWQRMWRDTT